MSSVPLKDIAASEIESNGKRKAVVTSASTNIDGHEKDGDGDAKRPRIQDDRKAHFRDWSKTASPSTVYTLKCIFGDPDQPLRSRIKTSKIAVLREMLQQQGLSTIGTKAVLLERIQKEHAWVRIEIDGRECLQRVVNAFLHYFGWDNDHLFDVTMPCRGPNRQGAVKPGGYPPPWSGNIRTAPQDNDSPQQRKLSGAAFDPWTEGVEDFDYEFEETSNPGGPEGILTLEELCVQAGDKLHFVYDFGDENIFVLQVESVEQSENLLPEVELGYDNPTRARLVKKGPARMRPQYYRM